MALTLFESPQFFLTRTSRASPSLLVIFWDLLELVEFFLVMTKDNLRVDHSLHTRDILGRLQPGVSVPTEET